MYTKMVYQKPSDKGERQIISGSLVRRPFNKEAQSAEVEDPLAEFKGRSLFMQKLAEQAATRKEERYANLQKKNEELEEQLTDVQTYERPKEESTGLRLMGDLQETFGITKAQAAGIVGNLDYETGGFKYLQEIKPVVPGSKGGRGFAMWTGPRRKDFESWAKENNLDPDSYEASFGFLVHEVQNTNEGRFMEDLEKTNTPEEAARVFSNQYLRPGKPNINQRISSSNNYYNMEE